MLPKIRYVLGAATVLLYSTPAQPQDNFATRYSLPTGLEHLMFPTEGARLTSPPVPPPPPKKTTVPSWPTIPPEQYDHFFYGELTITIVASIDELLIQCAPTAVRRTLGCSLLRQGKCRIVLLDDKLIRAANWNTGLILRHEMAHCNGWPADHPGLRAFKE